MSIRKGNTVRILLAIIIIMLAGACIYYYARSIVPFYYIAIPALLAGCVISGFTRRIWNKIIRSNRFVIGFITQSVAFTVILMFLTLSVNYEFSIPNSSHTDNACCVEKLYYEIRHQNKRVGKKYLPVGNEYKVYFMDVRFANGIVKTISINHNTYRRFASGDSICLKMETGLFDIPVIKSFKFD